MDMYTVGHLNQLVERFQQATVSAAKGQVLRALQPNS